MESYNQMDYYNQSRPIHLCAYLPYGTKRPKAFCGAKIRRGVLYDTYKNAMKKMNKKGKVTYAYEKTGPGQSALRSAIYENQICQKCVDSPDAALHLLATAP